MKSQISKGAIKLIAEYEWEVEALRAIQGKRFKAEDHLVQTPDKPLPTIFLNLER